MKLLIAFSALSVVAAQNYCRENGCSYGEVVEGDCYCDDDCVAEDDCCADYTRNCDGNSGTLCEDNGCDAGYIGSGDCHCDDQCEEEGDCCSDYTRECTEGSTGRGDGLCAGCPSGPQSNGRTECWCDEACRAQGDCCPGYSEDCGDDLTDDIRMAYCELLKTSRVAFCDGSMRKSGWIDMVPRYEEGADNIETGSLTYEETCVTDPEIDSDEASYCDHDDYVGYSKRYACFGFNTILYQRCELDSDCDDEDCHGPWMPTYWGDGGAADQCSTFPPEQYTEGGVVCAGAEAETSGACQVYVDFNATEAIAWVNFCTDIEYAADQVEEFWTDEESELWFPDGWTPPEGLVPPMGGNGIGPGPGPIGRRLLGDHKTNMAENLWRNFRDGVIDGKLVDSPVFELFQNSQPMECCTSGDGGNTWQDSFGNTDLSTSYCVICDCMRDSCGIQLTPADGYMYNYGGACFEGAPLSGENCIPTMMPCEYTNGLLLDGLNALEDSVSPDTL